MTFDPDSNLWFRDPLRPDEPIEIDGWWLSRARVPERYWSCSLDAVDDGLDYKAFLLGIREKLPALLDKGGSLLFVGDYGAGKTGAAVSMLKESMRIRARGLFVGETEIADIFGSHHMRDTRQRVLKQQVLVFDDIGAQRKNDFGLTDSLVYRVIRARYDAGISTFVTTNLDIPGLMGRYPSLVTIFKACYRPVVVAGMRWRDQESLDMEGFWE